MRYFVTYCEARGFAPVYPITSTDSEQGESQEAQESTDPPVDASATASETEEPETGGDTDSAAEPAKTSQSQSEAPDFEFDALEERIVSVERRLDELETTIETKTAQLETNIEETVTDGGKQPGSTAIDDPTLVAKLIRAAVADDAITEDEEVRIIEGLQ